MNKLFFYWDTFLTSVVHSPAACGAGLRQLRARFEAPSAIEQSLLFKRLAMLLQSGLPMSASLRLLIDESASATKQARLRLVIELVEGGVSLHRALERAAYQLSTFAHNLIQIGESLGTLPDNLDYVAKELKIKHELRKQIIQSLIYPAIIIIATIAISVFLVVVIFPKIIPIFQSVHSTLPWSTRALMFISRTLTQYGLWFAAAIPVSLVFGWWVRQFPVVRRALAVWTLRLPIVGRLLRSYHIATGCRTLGMLLASDVRIVEALGIVTESTAQVVYAEAWRSITLEIQTGQRLSTELRKYPTLFPAVVVQLVHAGETTGNLSHTLRYLASMYEEEVRDITKNLTTLLEPVLMLVMGLIVGFIAVSIITPIYGITQNLHG